MNSDSGEFSNEETKPAMWGPFRRTEHEDVSTAIVDLRRRVTELETSDRQKDATLDAHRIELAELRGIAYEQRARLSEVLSKLDLGFNTLTSLVNGLKKSEQPFSEFK